MFRLQLLQLIAFHLKEQQTTKIKHSKLFPKQNSTRNEIPCFTLEIPLQTASLPGLQRNRPESENTNTTGIRVTKGHFNKKKPIKMFTEAAGAKGSK